MGRQGWTMCCLSLTAMDAKLCCRSLVKTPSVLCSASWPSPSTTPLQFNTLWVPEQQLSSSEMSQPDPGILQIEFKSQLCFGMLSVKCFNLPVPNQEALPVLGLRASHHLQIQLCTHSDPLQFPGVLVCPGVSLVSLYALPFWSIPRSCSR